MRRNPIVLTLLVLLVPLVLMAAATPKSYYRDAVHKSELAHGLIVTNSQAVTCADNETGSSPAACTITPTSSFVQVTCADADGCALTLSETGAVDGQRLLLVNAGTNSLTIADSSGVQEVVTSLTLGAIDNVQFTYLNDGSAAYWFQSTPLVNN